MANDNVRSQDLPPVAGGHHHYGPQPPRQVGVHTISPRLARPDPSPRHSYQFDDQDLLHN